MVNYAASREETFGNLKQWMEEVNRKYNEVQTSNVVIVANKTDLPCQVQLDAAQVPTFLNSIRNCFKSNKILLSMEHSQ